MGEQYAKGYRPLKWERRMVAALVCVAGAAFLGSQGDVWDAQKDILCDTLGALCSSGLFLWRVGGMRLSAMRGDGENSGKEGWL